MSNEYQTNIKQMSNEYQMNIKRISNVQRQTNLTDVVYELGSLDHVFIVTGSDYGPLQAKYCDVQRTPFVVVSSSSEMFLMLGTEVHWQYVGFTAEYAGIPASSKSKYI